MRPWPGMLQIAVKQALQLIDLFIQRDGQQLGSVIEQDDPVDRAALLIRHLQSLGHSAVDDSHRLETMKELIETGIDPLASAHSQKSRQRIHGNDPIEGFVAARQR